MRLAKELSRLVNYISSVGFKSFELSEANGRLSLVYYKTLKFSNNIKILKQDKITSVLRHC